MNLFDYAGEQVLAREAPLAKRMQPRTLDQFVGQQDIVGPGRLLRRAIQADRLSSVIFYGPPGTGKTTLARVMANSTKAVFVQVNAVTSGVAELREVIRGAKDQLGQYGRRTVLFVDEIHRFNKSQQDVLLPHMEDGTLTLIGATTENPFYALNSPLLSRSRIFKFNPLTPEDIRRLLERALQDSEHGLANYRVQVEEAALAHIINMSDGDARTALNALELAVLTTPPDQTGVRPISLAVAEESIQRRAVRYDRAGDNHYDTISAFIKSVRGSDPDAALHWLARMISAGEDPRFIARRLVILSAEDIGLADPRAMPLAVAALQAAEVIGMPEARIILAEATVYLATAPKSNSAYLGIDAALADVAGRQVGPVPVHLRDSSHSGARREWGHGRGYKYPHDFPGHYVEQQYLPDDLQDQVYYRPGDNETESLAVKHLQQIKNMKAR